MKHRKLIAFLAAIIATFAIWQFLNTQNKNKEAQMDYREVIVAAGEIKKGEVIPRSKLTLKKIPRQYTPEDALEDGNSAIGKMAQSGILSGEILTTARLMDTENGQAGLAYKIPEGSRAITLNVDTETGVSGMVMPGDEVDLIVSLTGAGRVENVHPDGAPPGGDGLDEQAEALVSGGASVNTGYLMEKVRVLACGSELSREAAGQIESETGKMYDSVTLSVTREEALQIEFYTYLSKNYNGNIRMTLHPADKQAESSVNDTRE